MAIVPVYPVTGIVSYVRPLMPTFYPAYYPAPICLGLPIPVQAYPTVDVGALPFGWEDPVRLYRVTNAAYNPGSFWIWPPDR